MKTAQLLQQTNGDTLVLVTDETGMITNTYDHLGQFNGYTVTVEDSNLRITRTELQPVDVHEDIPITEGLPAPVGDPE